MLDYFNRNMRKGVDQVIGRQSSSIPRMIQLIIKNERKMAIMNKAAKLNNINPDYSPVAQKNTISCPCSAEEVYSIGIDLQYLIGDMYLNLVNSSKGSMKSTLKELAMKQLDKKVKIQKLANINLNEKLNYFYNNGGPIIEPPVSKRQAQEINGFFTRIVNNRLNQINVIINKANDYNDDLNDLENEVNQIMKRMFTDLANLYNEDEIISAFLAMNRL